MVRNRDDMQNPNAWYSMDNENSQWMPQKLAQLLGNIPYWKIQDEQKSSVSENILKRYLIHFAYRLDRRCIFMLNDI